MTLNGSDIRDTARVLHISTNMVIKKLKKASATITSKFIDVTKRFLLSIACNS